MHPTSPPDKEEIGRTNPHGETDPIDCPTPSTEHYEFLIRQKLAKTKAKAPSPGCYYLRYYPENPVDHVAYFEGTLRVSPHTFPIEDGTDYSIKPWEISDIPAFSERLKILTTPLGPKIKNSDNSQNPTSRPPASGPLPTDNPFTSLYKIVDKLKAHEREKEELVEQLFGVSSTANGGDYQLRGEIQKLTDKIESIHREIATFNKRAVEFLQKSLELSVGPNVLTPFDSEISPMVAGLRSRLKNPLNPISPDRFRRLVAESLFHEIITPHASHQLRVSGDLYVRTHQFRDIAEPLSKDKSLLSSPRRLAAITIKSLTKLIDIPRFARDRYRYYLKPTFIQPGNPSPNQFSAHFQVNPFDVEKNEFVGEGTRRFRFFKPSQEELRDIQRDLIGRKLSAPKRDLQSDEILKTVMIGSVTDGHGRSVGKAVIARVSKRFLRRAQLEIRYTGEQGDCSRIPGGPVVYESNNWTKVFESVDWNLAPRAEHTTIDLINAVLSKPGEESNYESTKPAAPPCAVAHLIPAIPKAALLLKDDHDLSQRAFTPEELHLGMEADKNPNQSSQRLPAEIPTFPTYSPHNRKRDRELDFFWKYHLLCVPKIKGYGRGVMYDIGIFDKNKYPGEGAAVAWNYQFPDAGTVLMFHQGQAKQKPWDTDLVEFPDMKAVLITEDGKGTQGMQFSLGFFKFDRDARNNANRFKEFKEFTFSPLSNKVIENIFQKSQQVLAPIIEYVRTEALGTEKTGIAETPNAAALVNILLRLCAVPESTNTEYERSVFSPITEIVNKRLNEGLSSDIQSFRRPPYCSQEEFSRLYFRTAVHEVGHLMGLSHNFISHGFMNTTDIIAANWPLLRAQEKHAELQQLYLTQSIFLDHERQQDWDPKKRAGDSVRNADSKMRKSHLEVSQTSLKALRPKIAKARKEYQEMIEDVKEFPKNVILEFDPYDADYLRHGPDICVRPGAKVANPIPNETLKKSLIAQGLQLSIRPIRPDFPFGAPVRIEIQLKNITDQGSEPRNLFVPDSLNLEHGGLRGWTISPRGHISFLEPIATRDDEIASIRTLSPGASIQHSATLIHGANQALFSIPGVFKLNLTFSWELVSERLLDTNTIQEFKVAALQEIDIVAPESDLQNVLAERILSNTELARHLVSDGATPGHSELLQTLQEVPQLARHYDLSIIRWYYEMFKAPPTETLRNTTARAASLETAARAYRPDTVATEAELSLALKAVADFHLLDPERAPKVTFPPVNTTPRESELSPEDLLANKVLSEASAQLPGSIQVAKYFQGNRAFDANG